MERWFADLSLSKKIYLPNFIIITLLIIASAFVANRVVSDIMIRRITSSTRQSLDIIMQSLDSVLNDIEAGAARVAGDPVVQNMLSKPRTSAGPEGLDNYFLVRTILEKILYLRNFVDAISVYHLDGTLLGSGAINYRLSADGKHLSEGLVKMVTDAGRNLWLDPGTVMYSVENPSTSGVTMLRTVRQGNLGEVVGVLEVNLNESIFSRLYSHLDYGKTGRFIVVNRQGMMIFPETKDYGLYNEFLRRRYLDWATRENTQGRLETFGREKFIVISNYLERLGWVVIGMVPLGELLDYGRRMTLSIYLIGFFCIVLEVLFALWITRFITKPVVELSESMIEAAHGDLQIRVAEGGRDELGRLSRTFNEMVGRISGLMDQVYVEQKRQRELELLALQSQINPHFLYNSLESLCALSQLGRCDDAYTLGKSLSLFYRGVLSGGRPVVRIRDEVNTLRHYLRIQDIRYQDKFSYKFFVADEILDRAIIKLTLQPLVENAIYHGLKNTRRRGMIWIIGRMEGEDQIRLTVTDNGAGMEAEAVDEVLRGRNGARRGFGLVSVDQRIKLFFGERYGLSIESRTGYFTRVHILLPAASE